MMPKLYRALVVSAASLGLLATPALAQDDPDPAGPVERCVGQINEVRAQTVQALNQGARRAAAAIRQLDDNGAGEEALTAAAAQAAQGLTEVRNTGARAARAIASSCVEFLAMNEAPPPAIRFVLGAQERALGAINGQYAESLAQVRRALRRALSPDPDGGPEGEPGDGSVGVSAGDSVGASMG